MPAPFKHSAAKRRPSPDRRKRMQQYKEAVGYRCEGCGVKHGKLTAVRPNEYHRVELRMAFRNGNRTDFRWVNFVLVCPSCAPQYAATFNPTERDPRALAPGEGGA